MNDTVQLALDQIMTRYPGIYKDPVRFKGLLQDYLAGGHRREINLLICAVDEKVVRDLAYEKDTALPEILLYKLTQRLVSNCGLSLESASWAVETWALALGILAIDDSWKEE